MNYDHLHARVSKRRFSWENLKPQSQLLKFQKTYNKTLAY